MKTLQTIKELVQIKSFDEQDNKQIIEYLINKFKPISKEIIKIKNPDSERYNLIVGLNTKIENINALILSGHIDTVIADENAYDTNPYEAVLVDDKLYGLGIIDMKSYFACILNNLQMLANQSLPIIIAITCDEETSLKGIDLIINTLKERKVKTIFSIIGEPTDMCVCTTSKCCYEYEIEVIGKSCHSSNPNNGINAIYIISKIVSQIEILNLKYENTTLSCGVIFGGEKVNIVPNYAKIKFDIRSNSKQKVDDVINDINQIIEKLTKIYLGCNICFNRLFAIPALEKKTGGLTDQIVSNFKLKEKEFTGGCEAGYFLELGGESILFGVGNLSLAHKPNEFLNIKEFEVYNKIFTKLIKYVCQFSN